ncbi:MAG: hypothetical protein ACJ8GW_10705 [Massilia sp.]
MHIIAAALIAQLATAQPAAVAENWAAPAPATPAQIAETVKAIVPDKAMRQAVKVSIEAEKALVEEKAKAAAIPRPYVLTTKTDADRYAAFAVAFDDAKVPGCLQPDGLKRQSTLIFGGLLALPFIAVAALRGKCN